MRDNGAGQGGKPPGEVGVPTKLALGGALAKTLMEAGLDPKNPAVLEALGALIKTEGFKAEVSKQEGLLTQKDASPQAKDMGYTAPPLSNDGRNSTQQQAKDGGYIAPPQQAKDGGYTAPAQINNENTAPSQVKDGGHRTADSNGEQQPPKGKEEASQERPAVSNSSRKSAPNMEALREAALKRESRGQSKLSLNALAREAEKQEEQAKTVAPKKAPEPQGLSPRTMEAINEMADKRDAAERDAAERDAAAKKASPPPMERKPSSPSPMERKPSGILDKIKASPIVSRFTKRANSSAAISSAENSPNQHRNSKNATPTPGSAANSPQPNRSDSSSLLKSPELKDASKQFKSSGIAADKSSETRTESQNAKEPSQAKTPTSSPALPKGPPSQNGRAPGE